MVSAYIADRDGAARDNSGSDAGADSPELPKLTPAEDAEMRQLAWFAKAGDLSERSQARLSELRARDRRTAIRDPRPDPTTGSTGPATSFRSERAVLSPCPNCGFGVLRPDASTSSCSNCGFTVRTDEGPLPDPATAPEPTAGVEGPEKTQGLDKASYFVMLVKAARGDAQRGSDQS